MKLYTCTNCQHPLYFENSVCLNCNHFVGFDAFNLTMVSLESQGNQSYYDIANKNNQYRYCKNSIHATCNWIIPATQASPYCQACDLNRVIPLLDNNANLQSWQNIEIAKHRLIYSLLKLRLPVSKKIDNQISGIAFDFMADASPELRVITGHDNGTITLNIEEADEAARAKNKLHLGERYRTLLGHFRHEIGHYYWDVLLKDGPSLQAFRQLFGNEEQDYSIAMDTYYQNGAPPDWSNQFISPYATMHPWEDWAESWAHYLHMMDTLETAFYFGIGINAAELPDDAAIQARIFQDPYKIPDFDRIIKWWLPLTFAVNSLNRSMGHHDFYPFVISAPVIQKLRFIHELCLQQATALTSTQAA